MLRELLVVVVVLREEVVATSHTRTRFFLLVAFSQHTPALLTYSLVWVASILVQISVHAAHAIFCCCCCSIRSISRTMVGVRNSFRMFL